MRTGARQADDGSDTERRCPALSIRAPASDRAKTAITASYVHAYFPSNPEAAARLFAP